MTADDVTHGKPDPEGYLLGAKLLGVSPTACIAIEDSPSGIAVAKSAGMHTIAVTTTHSNDELHAADRIKNRLGIDDFIVV